MRDRYDHIATLDAADWTYPCLGLSPPRRARRGTVQDQYRDGHIMRPGAVESYEEFAVEIPCAVGDLVVL